MVIVFVCARETVECFDGLRPQKTGEGTLSRGHKAGRRLNLSASVCTEDWWLVDEQPCFGINIYLQCISLYLFLICHVFFLFVSTYSTPTRIDRSGR